MILKWTIRILLSLIALAAGFAGLVIVINWYDEAPSADALYFEELSKNLPKVPVQNNAYLYLLGFNAKEGVDPFEIGLKKHSFTKVEDGAANYDWEAEKRLPTFTKLERDEELDVVMTACSRPYLDCKNKLAAQDDWTPYLSKSDWVINRYQALLALKYFRNIDPVDMNLPLPSYQPIFEGQKLYLISLLKTAAEGNGVVVEKSLSDDLQFWRMVLASSDTLLEKMIATAAIRNHFYLGNIVLSRLPPGSQLSAIPDSWATPLSRNEYAFDRALIGEYRFVSSALRSVRANELPYLQDSSYETPKVWQIFISKCILKKQATNNIFARLLRAGIERSHVGDIKMFARDVDIRSDVDLGIYNFFGRTLAQDTADVSYDEYFRRVADIEGFRRASLAIVNIRAKQLPLESWADFLKISEYRDPYTDKAFGIDAERKAVVFEGLGKEPNKVFYAEF